MADTESGRIAERDRWLAGSAFVDADGHPVTWYHGTDAAPFNVFSRWDEFSIGFHFGGPEAAQARVAAIAEGLDAGAEGCAVMQVICRARNPLRLRDHYTWGFDRLAGELVDLGVIDDETGDAIVDTCDDSYVFAALEAAGHDCILYANECEFKERQTDSLIVWRAELLKSPLAASFDPEDPRLLPQHPADDGDMGAWRRLRASIAAAREALPTLAGGRKPAFA